MKIFDLIETPFDFQGDLIRHRKKIDKVLMNMSLFKRPLFDNSPMQTTVSMYH